MDVIVWAGQLIDRLQSLVQVLPSNVITVAGGGYTLPLAQTYMNRDYYILAQGSVTISVQPGDVLDGNPTVAKTGMFVSDGHTWHRFI